MVGFLWFELFWILIFLVRYRTKGNLQSFHHNIILSDPNFSLIKEIITLTRPKLSENIAKVFPSSKLCIRIYFKCFADVFTTFYMLWMFTFFILSLQIVSFVWTTIILRWINLIGESSSHGLNTGFWLTSSCLGCVYQLCNGGLSLIKFLTEYWHFDSHHHLPSSNCHDEKIMESFNQREITRLLFEQCAYFTRS